ncbi:MAG: hypothetical protein AB7K04_01945 [Pseudorhodoplanes sp.]
MTRKNAPMGRAVSLRAAAAALGISRKKLLRFIGDGLPVTRDRERVLVNLSEAEAWVALNDLGEARVRKAALLSPADPRYRDRLAAAEIRRIEFAIKQGHAVDIEALGFAHEDDLARLRSQLVLIPARADDDARLQGTESLQKFLAGAVEDALHELKMDSPSEWPTPSPMPDTSTDAPDADKDDEDRDMLPVLAASDPRYALNDTKAMEREARLAELRRSMVGIEEGLAIAKEDFDRVRARLRKVPARVMRSIEKTGATVHATARYELDCAMAELGGHKKPPRLQSEFDFDEEEFEDVGMPIAIPVEAMPLKSSAAEPDEEDDGDDYAPPIIPRKLTKPATRARQFARRSKFMS